MTSAVRSKISPGRLEIFSVLSNFHPSYDSLYLHTLCLSFSHTDTHESNCNSDAAFMFFYLARREKCIVPLLLIADKVADYRQTNIAPFFF